MNLPYVEYLKNDETENSKAFSFLRPNRPNVYYIKKTFI